ncbi:MAG: hypothetical protein ACLUNO_02420 [Oscillospiraceae bacterium]
MEQLGLRMRRDAAHARRARCQVYLPDLKYALSGPAARYSAAADYPQVARAAILEMYRQTGPFRLDDDGMLQRGVLIRHPHSATAGENTRRVIDWVGETFAPGQVLFSLMESVHARRRSGAVAGTAAPHFPRTERRNVSIPDREPDRRRLLSGPRCRDRRHDPGVRRHRRSGS